MSVSDQLQSTISLDLFVDLFGIHRGASRVQSTKYPSQSDGRYHLNHNAGKGDTMAEEIAWPLAIGVDLSRGHSTENTERDDRR